uniref:Uncharacterized protein n=1 Tax=Medicago truncatula TaxID=3880 RepID=Q2HSZ2_MEDTR|nr:hypothetical protein MtrDRAFT_AC150889g33v2 [Medicago truncatula]
MVSAETLKLFCRPLVKNSVSEYDKAINNLKVKYRTYIVELSTPFGEFRGCSPKLEIPSYKEPVAS